MSNDQIKMIAFIPAQPGWFVGTFMKTDRGGEFHKEPIIAWEFVNETLIYDDWNSAIRRARPITANQVTNAAIANKQVIYASDGRIIYLGDYASFVTVADEATAMAHIRQLYAPEETHPLGSPRSGAAMDFQTLFGRGMKRYLPPLIARQGKSLDIGASGKYVVLGAEPLGPPNWVWPRDPIPAENDSVATIHAYHLFEHLPGADAASLMREIERVLVPGGVLNFSVPYYTTTLAIQNLEHKSFWCEDTLKNLFEDDTYDHEQGRNWRLRVHFLVIVGLAQRNLALVGQIVKDAPKTGHPKWYYPDSGTK